ncbi:sucrase ferredoxin [Halomonas sp. PAMB 3264]|uniref:sucrase ferredoxin n=1 Tax=Halomonas sp. PAMB 3264 TaxID=3075222 RepID=UPI002897F2C8|nr:sucrase ferredoxin [Halomonas sp. PAMB 3264]WNL43177.1 sucrase ferredoxin [Halomonas sp. PAMB 3264]
MTHTFCAELSQQQHDPLAGSAAHAEHNLLISWPRAKWQRNLRHASDMADSLKTQLDEIAATGRRVNLIHRRAQDATCHQVFLMPERRRFDVARDELSHFLDRWRQAHSLARWEQAPPEADLILCCTHGKKDKCCAKYGYRTYKALAAAVLEHALPFDVWESSHLGGCRLATSLVVLPRVRKYGRLRPEQVLPFLRAEASGRRFLPGYRGDSRLTPAQQCAEVALLERLEFEAPFSQLMLTNDQGDEQQRTLRWQCEQGGHTTTFEVQCQSMALLRVDTCADLDQGPTESLVWQATRIEAMKT